MRKLHLGCSNKIFDGWVNVDYSLGARVVHIPVFGPVAQKLGVFNIEWDKRIFLHNLVEEFPWKEHEIKVVYSSHTLEHMTREDGARFLSECYRVLEPGGIIRIVVPDLKYHVDAYNDGDVLAENFIESLHVLYDTGSGKFSSLKKRFAPFFQFPHKCMYDSSALVRVMKGVGFDATVKAPFESEISDINMIEGKGRTRNAVIVEGVKPRAS